MYLFSDGFQIGEREADRGIQLGYLKKKNLYCFRNVPHSFLSQSPHYINEKVGPKK